MAKPVVKRKPLRVAFFLERFPCLSETFILNQIVYLIDQGYSIDIYADGKDNLPVHAKVNTYNLLAKVRYPDRPQGFGNKLRNLIKIWRSSLHKGALLKTLNVLRFGKSAYTLRTFFEYAQFSQAPEYDILHAHFGPKGSEVIAAQKLGFFRGTPLVTTFHGYDINPLKLASYRHAYRDLFADCRLITANSFFTMNLLKEAGCPESKMIKLPVSLDTTFFVKKPVPKVNDTIHILFCGRLIDFKAPDVFIDVAHELVSGRGYSQLRFHLVGTGPLQELVDQKVATYRLHDYVTFHGSLTQEEIIATMSAMDVFLYPGIYDQASGRAENQGLVLQEAQALELPVVTSNVGGIPEGLIDGSTGFVVSEKDIAGFADKVETLVLDPALREQMARKARAYVVANFDNQVIGQKLEEHYQALL